MVSTRLTAWDPRNRSRPEDKGPWRWGKKMTKTRSLAVDEFIYDVASVRSYFWASGLSFLGFENPT